ncbi:MAG: glycine zipper 2TM domain-containing protein [Zoogloeaceae bacterium]|nr:glycine zipper 2TM domain-containing protein [Zoogloeaceae bacterium]
MNISKTGFSWIAIALVALLLGGCASGLGGGTYERGEARRAMEVEMGTVESVRAVRLEGTKTPVGTIAGGAVGGIAGSSVGGGSGRNIAMVIGAVAGGLAGSAIEEGATRSNGVEVTVQLDSGRLIAVVQEDQGENFAPGQRVRLVKDGRTTRVTR